MSRAVLETEFEIDWADCDPAGIVFYPNFFRIMDTAMQRLMRARGLSQQVVRERFGAIGTPLVEAHAAFRSPARPGDRLTLVIEAPAWRGRVFRVDYKSRIGDRMVFEGYEVRILAAEAAGGQLRALELPDAFRRALDPGAP
jgi:acyl-CoA thioesterase FadM